MKKIAVLVGALGMVFGGAVHAGKVDCTTVSNPENESSCVRECGRDSSPEFCKSICLADGSNDFCMDLGMAPCPADASEVFEDVDLVQAQGVMDGHCSNSDLTASDIANMFGGVTAVQVEGQIKACEANTRVSDKCQGY